MRTEKKQKLRQLRRWRIRKKVVGTNVRPRMAVLFTGKNIYVQFIDDLGRTTLAATSSLSKAIGETEKIGANVTGAKRIGSLAAEVAKTKGISKVVFDRAGARFHGKLKALADAAREGGLQF